MEGGIIVVLFSLLFALYGAVDPETPQVVKATFPSFVINETQKIFSSENSNDPSLLAPYPFTSLTETIETLTTFPNSTTRTIGTYYIQSHKDEVFFFPVLNIDTKNYSLSFPTLGPCAGNGLETQNQLIWSKLDFTIVPDTLRGISLNGTISRVYQNALLPLDVPQWILFGLGVRSYYAINVPLNDNSEMFLQIELRRHDTSVLPPSKFFYHLSIVTDQKCLNLGVTNPNKPGIMRLFYINGTSENDMISYTLEDVPLPSGSNVYLTLDPQGPNCCQDLSRYDKKYSITASIKMITPPSPPTEPTGPSPVNHALDVFGIVCGCLVIIGVFALAIGIYIRKRKGQYIMIQ